MRKTKKQHAEARTTPQARHAAKRERQGAASKDGQPNQTRTEALPAQNNTHNGYLCAEGEMQ